MSHTVIRVENLSKRYWIGHQRDVRDALRHRIEDALRHPFQWISDQKRKLGATQEEFWALKDVSFEVQQGEVVGIIGRNGAGKSTLLKILSQISEPTTGRIRIQGRVASLLEVGTGFHQELTGRENIFLNGAILGMTRKEIKRKFDEIVTFSEVEKFLDTPVKRYSSGMYVRLAFSVAAHLEPDILIVDEVLAVGDATFQKKCLGKMSEAARGGRTVLFVSHNMGAVQTLCSKAIYLQSGTVHAVGEVQPMVKQYLLESGASRGRGFTAPVRLGDVLNLEAFDFDPNPVASGESVRFCVVFRATKPTTFKDLTILIDSALNARAAVIDCRPIGFPVALGADQIWQVEGTIRALPLVEGDYSVGLMVNAGDYWENVFELTSLTVNPRLQEDGHVPIPLMYRGLVEMDYTVGAHLPLS